MSTNSNRSGAGQLAAPNHEEGHDDHVCGIDADWTKPGAMAIPKEGYFALEQGRYGPIYPRTPACYGFTIIAKIKPGTERRSGVREEIEEAIDDEPELPRAAASCTTCDGCSSTSVRTSTSCIRASSIPISTNTPRTQSLLFKATGIDTVFENLEGFPEDWKTNAPAFIKFVREHQCPSFLEYGEYPYVIGDEIKKALALKDAFASMLDQMQ